MLMSSDSLPETTLGLPGLAVIASSSLITRQPDGNVSAARGQPFTGEVIEYGENAEPTTTQAFSISW